MVVRVADIICRVAIHMPPLCMPPKKSTNPFSTNGRLKSREVTHLGLLPTIDGMGYRRHGSEVVSEPRLGSILLCFSIFKVWSLEAVENLI